MSDELAPPILDRELPEEVADAREHAQRVFKSESKQLRKPIKARVAGYRNALRTLASMIQSPLETSDLDLAADTRWTALHLLCGRSLSLGFSLLCQVEAGFGLEAYPTARAIHEANRMIMVFEDPEESGLLRQWLDGRPLKPQTVRKALDRVFERENLHRRAKGLEEIPSLIKLDAELYGYLSKSGHLVRESLAGSVSHTTRRMVIGQNPEYAVRAHFVAWAGEVVIEIAHVVGGVLNRLAGRNFRADCMVPLWEELEAVCEANPLPDDIARDVPAEFVLAEDNEPDERA